MSIKLFQWSADKAGCWAYRMKFPRQAIEKGPNAEEFEIECSMTIPTEWQEMADIVVGQRVTKDGPTRLWQKWSKEGKKRLVYELDDDLFHVDPENHNAYTFFSKPDIQRNLVNNIRASHTVTVSTEPLADVIREKTGHTDVRVVPNAIPAWLLKHQADEDYTLGYMGSPTHHKDIKPVANSFKKFFERNPEATFHAIGFDYGEFMNIPEAQRTFTKWIPDAEEAMRSLDFSFGVAPLAASVFNRSKSDIKALEMAALGRPCIVSSVPAYGAVKDGENGLVVRRDHEWSRALKKMYEDEDMRRELGNNARKWAESRTNDAVRELWEKAYLGL